MKILSILFACLGGVGAGCQSSPPPPASGMSSLRVRVLAEPKGGYSSPADRVQVYDAPGKRTNPTGDFETVDYSALKEIVVWLEPVSGAAAKAPPATASIEVDARK